MTLPVGPDHIWSQMFESAKRFTAPKGALFLDRDGVIVEEVHYLHKVEDVSLIKGAAEVISKANRLNIPVVIVTNQSGLARKMFGWEDFARVQQRMLDLLRTERAAFVDAVYACPFHKNGTKPYQSDHHEARKPNPGMLHRAMNALPIVPERSVMIGDKASDIKAAKAAGLAGGIQVLSGHGNDPGEREKSLAVGSEDFFVKPAETIAHSVDVALFDLMAGGEGP